MFLIYLSIVRRIIPQEFELKIVPFEASRFHENRVSTICRLRLFGIGIDNFHSKLDFLENETSNGRKKERKNFVSDLPKRA